MALGAVRVERDRLIAALIGRQLVARLAAIAAELRHFLQMHFVREIEAVVRLALGADDGQFRMRTERSERMTRRAATVVGFDEIDG